MAQHVKSLEMISWDTYGFGPALVTSAPAAHTPSENDGLGNASASTNGADVDATTGRDRALGVVAGATAGNSSNDDHVIATGSSALIDEGGNDSDQVNEDLPNQIAELEPTIEDQPPKGQSAEQNVASLGGVGTNGDFRFCVQVTRDLEKNRVRVTRKF